MVLAFTRYMSYCYQSAGRKLNTSSALEYRWIRRRRQRGRTIHRVFDRSFYGGIAVALANTHRRDLAARCLRDSHHAARCPLARSAGRIQARVTRAAICATMQFTHTARAQLVRALFGLQRLAKFRITRGLFASQFRLALLFGLALGVGNPLFLGRLRFCRLAFAFLFLARFRVGGGLFFGLLALERDAFILLALLLFLFLLLFALCLFALLDLLRRGRGRPHVLRRRLRRRLRGRRAPALSARVPARRSSAPPRSPPRQAWAWEAPACACTRRTRTRAHPPPARAVARIGSAEIHRSLLRSILIWREAPRVPAWLAAQPAGAAAAPAAGAAAAPAVASAVAPIGLRVASGCVMKPTFFAPACWRITIASTARP